MVSLKKLLFVVLTFFISTFSFSNTEAAEKKIVINVASCLMQFFDGNTLQAIYPVCLGRPEKPTPTGYFQICEKVVDPTWIDPNDENHQVAPGSDNPLGKRWMEFFGNYGIHGNNDPYSIGQHLSEGCVRMRNKDVETIFDLVEVGTPVEIFYNRIVVEKNSEDDILYYIYPDIYNCQDITIDEVVKWIEPFGVSSFISDANIEQKIIASDGKPTIIAKVFNIDVDGERVKDISVDGTKFFSKAVTCNGVTYLPIVPIAKTLKLKLDFYPQSSTIETKYGKTTCLLKRKQLYCNLDDLNVLFNLEGSMQILDDGSRIFVLSSIDPVKS